MSSGLSGLMRQTWNTQKDRLLARTNYSFAKRQKEIAKKKKKEEKRQSKLEKRKNVDEQPDEPVTPED